MDELINSSYTFLQEAMMSAKNDDPIDPMALIDALREFQARIPEFTQLSNEQTLVLRKAASVSQDWIVHAISAIGESESVQRAVGASVEELQDEIAAADRWDAVETELYVMMRGVAAANLIRRHRIGRIVLQAYGISRQLVRDPQHMHLLPHVETLRRMNRLGPRKRKKEG